MKIIKKINGSLTVAALISAIYASLELIFRPCIPASDKWLLGCSLVWLVWVGIWTALDRKRCK